MINSGLHRIAAIISRDIEEKFNKIGLLYRIFYRAKDHLSIEEKINKKKYSENGKKLQDSIGIRIAAYFHDDLKLIKNILQDSYQLDNQTIDLPKENEFSPERMNLVFKLNTEYYDDFITTKTNPLVDSTFEVQIRTILSEGWHEVEHDLRYKCKDDWKKYYEESRILNGIWANLSNCDWSMNALFHRLAYNNYKSKEWPAMIRNKFRIRIKNSTLSDYIYKYMSDTKNNFSKELFRCDREEFLTALYKSKIDIPLIYDNVIYLVNFLSIKDEFILKKMPRVISDLSSI